MRKLTAATSPQQKDVNDMDKKKELADILTEVLSAGFLMADIRRQGLSLVVYDRVHHGDVVATLTFNEEDESSVLSVTSSDLVEVRLATAALSDAQKKFVELRNMATVLDGIVTLVLNILATATSLPEVTAFLEKVTASPRVESSVEIPWGDLVLSITYSYYEGIAVSFEVPETGSYAVSSRFTKSRAYVSPATFSTDEYDDGTDKTEALLAAIDRQEKCLPILRRILLSYVLFQSAPTSA